MTDTYFFHNAKLLVLEKGEYRCNNCKGTGKDDSKSDFCCIKCSGTGKLDWLENILGKRSLNMKVLKTRITHRKHLQLEDGWKIIEKEPIVVLGQKSLLMANVE